MTTQSFETLGIPNQRTIVSSLKNDATMAQLIKLAVITNNILVQTSLETFLRDNLTIRVNFLAKNGNALIDAMQVTRNAEIDILLVDIGSSAVSNLEEIRKLQNLLPAASIIIINADSKDENIFKALYAGAVSCFSSCTPITKIEEVITTTYHGGSYISPVIARKVLNYFSSKKAVKTSVLSNRQLQIVEGVVDGLSYKLIADKLLISIDTVRHHIKTIYRLLNINSKAELIKKSYEQELLVA